MISRFPCRLVLLFLITSWTLVSFANSICLSIENGLDRVCARDTNLDGTCFKKTGNKRIVGWNEDSCISKDGQDLITEIIQLNDLSTVPPKILKEHSTEKIAMSMLYRYFQKVERRSISDMDVLEPAYDVYSNALPLIAFHESILSKIIKNGFLNQHLTGTTNGTQDVLLRARAESNMIRLQLDNPYVSGVTVANRIRPKYTYGFFMKPHNGLKNGFVTQYGNILAGLKDEVKKRATLTSIDSLDYFSRYSGAPDINIRTFYTPSRTLKFNSSKWYNEVQIYGEIPFSQVAFLLVGCISATTKNLVVDELKKNNLQTPVFDCVTDNSLGYPRFFAGQLLYGTPSPESRIPKANAIRIQSASFGSNIPGVAKGNATLQAKEWCEGKNSCGYKVSLKFLPDPAPNKDKDFQISWTCSDDPKNKVYSKKIDASAVDQTVRLECPIL